MTNLTKRFRVTAGLACASAVLLVVTLVWKDWIEIVFRVDPDQGSGRAEWLIVAATSAATAFFSVAARLEWRHMRRLNTSAAGLS